MFYHVASLRRRDMYMEEEGAADLFPFRSALDARGPACPDVEYLEAEALNRTGQIGMHRDL